MAEKTPTDDDDPHVLQEPSRAEAPGDWEIDEDDESPWLRGLWMLILAVLFELGRAILWITGVLQFLWLVFAKEKNAHIAAFGKDLADWLARITLYVTGSTEERPFPFAKWGPEE